MNLNKTLIATMATGVTTTSAIPVVGWKKASIEVATFAVGFAGASVAMNVKVSNELDGTYRPLQKCVNSGSTILAANVAVQAQPGPYVIEIQLLQMLLELELIFQINSLPAKKELLNG